MDVTAISNSISNVTTAAGASAFQQQKVANNVQTSVMTKVHDSQKTEGADVLKMLEAASPQSSTNSFGGSVDVHA